MHKTCLFIAAVFVAGIAMADEKPLDVTITVVESPADLPDAVTKTIELPASVPADARARDSAQHGLDTANQARALGREFGQSIADEAKTKGKGRP